MNTESAESTQCKSCNGSKRRIGPDERGSYTRWVRCLDCASDRGLLYEILERLNRLEAKLRNT